MRCKIIVNPVAGRGKTESRIPQLRQLLNDNRLDYDLEMTRAPGQAEEIARRAGSEYDTVIAVGGDGTMNEVINGVMDTRTPVGFIPAGTGNDFARSLGIPLDWKKAVNVFQRGRKTPFDVGKDIDGYFGIILGLGFPSDVMHHANTSTNMFRGSSAITVSTLKVINKLRTYNVHITTDDADFSAAVTGVFILNTQYCGGGLQIAPEARHNDGWLDVAVMHAAGKFDFLTTLPKAYKGTHVGKSWLQFIRTKKITVTTEEVLRKDFDGNIYGQSPIEAELLPAALDVWVPA